MYKSLQALQANPTVRQLHRCVQARFAATTTTTTSTQQGTEHNPEKAVEEKAQEVAKTQTSTKTQTQLDEELRQKMSGISGDGGEAGIEYEDGQPVAMKRGVKNNMFRYI